MKWLLQLGATTFVTIARSADGKSWNKGDDVRVVTVSGVKYIRTDANNKAADNLGNLPEFLAIQDLLSSLD